jgi:hypothetical protein
MKLRDLTIATAVLAALMGALYWSNHHKAKDEEGVKASADVSPKILSLNQADIVAVRIDRQGQPELNLTRSQSGGWQITAPEPLPADQDSVSSMLATLSSLNSDRLLEEKAGDLAGYGLASPALSVDVTLKDNKTQKLLVGDQTPAGNSYYAMLAGDPRLFTLAGYNKTSLDKAANDLRDKRLLTEDFDKVSQIELLNQKPDKKQDITFAREKEAWQILKPKPYRADAFQVEDLIRALREAKFEASAEQNAKQAAAFKSASPVATVKIFGATGTQELELRKEQEDYLAKSTVVSGIYKVPASLGASLDKTLDDFRNKKLFDFSYSEPNKIEIQEGNKSYFFTRSGSDWWGPDGKKVDPNNVEDLISKLREFSTDTFPDSGFADQPEIEITVTSQDGKRVEKLSLVKSGGTYIAKRENEPTLYGLSSASVNDIEKAASDVKPATESKKK